MKLLRALLTAAVLLGLLAFLGSALLQFRDEASPRLVDPSGGVERSRIRVEILNGGGVAGAAQAATAELRDRGFDVVYFGNADEFGRDSTLILDRVGTLASARAVADAMGVRTVASDPDANLYVDVSVLLGTDWAPVEEVPEVAAPPPPWWDLRRFLYR